MILAAGIEQPRNLGMGRKHVRDQGGGLGLRADANCQRLQPLQQHPGVERRYRWAGLAHEIMDVLGDEGLRGEDDAAQAAALTVDMLGRGIDHDVGAER